MSDTITDTRKGEAWEFHEIRCSYCGVSLAEYKVCIDLECPHRKPTCTVTCWQDEIGYTSSDRSIHYCPSCTVRIKKMTNE